MSEISQAFGTAVAMILGFEPKLIEILDLPVGLRIRRRGDISFAFNFNTEEMAVPSPTDARFFLGGPMLEPFGVAAWK